MENKKSSQDKTEGFQKKDTGVEKTDAQTIYESVNEEIWKTMSVEVEEGIVHITKVLEVSSNPNTSIVRVTTYDKGDAVGVSSFLVPGFRVKIGKHAQTGENIVTLARGV